MTDISSMSQSSTTIISESCGVTASQFWQRVDRTGDCWLWQGLRHPKGYGRVYVPGNKVVLAHRMAWELTHGNHPCLRGPMLPHIRVCHHCDNPPCGRPDHLFLGTQADNLADRDAKGRTARGNNNGSRLHPDKLKRGEENSRARLTETDVRRIRAMRSEGRTYSHIAVEFGLSTTQARQIANRLQWAHVS